MTTDATPSMRRVFWRLFWQPPRAHGELVRDREVSFLEMFYDLVYVVLVSQAAHGLANDVTWRTLGNFAVVFALIWIAWTNGAQYHELHAREDGRSRVAMFAQMLVIAPLAAFTSYATGRDGAAFAITYTLLLVVFIWLWWSVRRIDSSEYHRTTGVYLVTMMAMVAAMLASAFVDESWRTRLWSAIVVAWVLGALVMRKVSLSSDYENHGASRSMVERVGLFVIIVLGEVVVGVVDGLSESPHQFAYVVTALLGMLVAFGLWWMYFDFVGRRMPADSGGSYSAWMLGHLPLTFSIAAIGGCMVYLVAHAGEARVSTAAAWVTSSAFAVAMLSLAILYRSLHSAHQYPRLYRKLVLGVITAVPIAFGIGALRPAPAVLLGSFAVLLTVVWGSSVATWMKSDAPAKRWPPGLSEQ